MLEFKNREMFVLSEAKIPAKGKEKIKQKLRDLWKDKRPFTKRLMLSGAVLLSFVFTFIFFGPLEMVAFSGNSLYYSYKDVLWLLLLTALAVWVVGSLLLALLRGKIFNYLASVIFVITLCGYLQAGLLNGDLGALTGDAIAWQEYRGSMLIGLGVWLAVLLVTFFVMYLHRKTWRRILTFVSLLLVVMQMAPTVGILTGSYKATEIKDISRYSLTTDGMYEFSSKDNIFVFVLDRLDYDYIEKALAEDADFFAPLDGFTAYTNAISVFARTQPALNHLLTGSDELAYRISDTEYYSRSWTEGGKDLLGTLKSKGYTNEIYSNIKYLFSDAAYATENVENVSNGVGEINRLALLKKMGDLSTYRYAPTAIKPFFWADTNYYNDVFAPAEVEKYGFNDAAHAAGFADSAAQRSESAFKLYHFFGPHAPYTLKEDGTTDGSKTSLLAQTKGSFNNLYKIFDQMKKLGIYENATILITADHGAAIDDSKPVSKPTRIGLFYKPSGAAGTPLTRSGAPVSTDQIPATLLKAAGADYAAYGKALDEIGETEQVDRVYYKSIENPETGDEVQVYKYNVVGDASVMENWKVAEVMDIQHSFY